MSTVTPRPRRRRWIRISLIVVAVLLLTAVLALHLLIRKGSCTSDVPFPAALQTADVDGRRMSWSLSGEAGEGRPTLVLITGLGSGQVTFAAVLERLAQHGRVITFDRPGYCASDAVPDGQRDADTMASELHALLRETDVPGPYVLVGHSLGGLIAESFAARYPQDVAGLVFDDARASDFMLRCIASLGESRCADPWWLGGLLMLAPTQAREFSALEDSEAQVRAITPAAQVPALVLSAGVLTRGDDFLTVWLDSQRGLATRYAARQITFEDSEHFLHTQDPDRFVALVGDFVDALPAQTPAIEPGLPD